jgi:phage-related protein
MNKKFIAYQGEEFTIEWYFDNRGKSEALEYYTALPLDRKKKLAHLFHVLGEMGEIKNEEKFRNEGNQIYAFKPIPDRFLCFFCEGSKVIITNAFEKKTNKLPPREKEKALKLKADYTKRCKEGTYYYD